MVAEQPQHFSWTSPSETSHTPSNLGTGCSHCCLHCMHVCSWVATLAAMRFAAPPVAVVLGGLVLQMGMPGQEGFPKPVLRWWRWFLQHCAAGVGSSGWIARALGAPGRCAQTDLSKGTALCSWGFGPILHWSSKALAPATARAASAAARCESGNRKRLLCPRHCQRPAPSFAQLLPRRLLNQVLTREKFSLSRGGRGLP